MKFVCDQCGTKYSIADDKVRRKVLKIRCKNCEKILVVRDPLSSSDGSVPRTGDGGTEDGFEEAFDGAFRGRRPVGGTPPHRKRHSGAALAAVDADLNAPPRPPPFESEAHEDEWYLAVDGHQFGPMGFAELCSRVKRGEARSEQGEDAYVWRDGFDDWLAVPHVVELRPYVPPPPPRGRSGLMTVGPGDVPTPLSPLPGPRPDGREGGGPRGSRISGLAPVSPGAAPGRSEGDRARPPAPPPASSLGGESAVELGQLAAGGRGAQAAVQPDGGAFSPVPGGFGAFQQRSRTPVTMKVIAVAAIIAALSGVAMLGYVLFAPQKDVAETAKGDRMLAAKTATRAIDESEPDEGMEATEFPPMEIGRTQATEKVVRGGRTGSTRRTSGGGKKSGAAKATQDVSAQDKRLLELYGERRVAGELPADRPTKSGPSRKGPQKRYGPSDLQRVQRANEQSIKTCYERAAKRDPSLANLRVDVELDIGDSGIVRSVKLRGAKSADLKSCLHRSLKRWVFPAYGAQTISFPLIFRGA